MEYRCFYFVGRVPGESNRQPDGDYFANCRTGSTGRNGHQPAANANGRGDQLADPSGGLEEYSGKDFDVAVLGGGEKLSRD
jgi:hypothetical protein